MKYTPYQELMGLRASRGLVKGYQYPDPSTNSHQSPEDYTILRDMFQNDSVLSTAIGLTVDLATYNGFDFDGTNKKKIEEARKTFNDDLDFDQVLDNVIYQILIYGDAFLELRKKGGTIKELHALETTEMEIKYDKHGRVEGYVQKPEGVSTELIPFGKDEILHFRLLSIGSQVYSWSPFVSIGNSYRTKVFANNYLQSIFKNLPPKMMYTIKGSARDRDNFEQILIRCKQNPNLDIVAAGEVQATVNAVNFDDGLGKILDYLRQEVLMITRVPPHWIGVLEGANRGIGENVVIPYETRIKKIQQKVASQVNRELMPKLGFNTIKFKFNPISLADEKVILECSRQLSDMGFDSETIIKYLRDKGFKLREGAKIEEPSIQDEKGFPSRKREGKADKMSVNIDKKGVSSEGKAKLQPKQELKK